MLTCQKASEICSAELDRPLTWSERAGLKVHLMMCSGCSNFRAHVNLMRRAMSAYMEHRPTIDRRHDHDQN